MVCNSRFLTIRHWNYTDVLKGMFILAVVTTVSNMCLRMGLIHMNFVAQNMSSSACHKRPVVSEKFKISKVLYSFENLTDLHGNGLSPGGHFRPLTCVPDQKVAIVIPYRDREDHLKILLNNLHPFLKKQNIDYTIFVVEQLPGSKFNRGMLRNIGFVEALKVSDFDCFFFHDVDMIPDDNGNVYRCGGQPRQHSRNLERWNHQPPYFGSFGGVVSMTAAQFLKVNGYSNTYFEWGLEDDEMGNRLKLQKMRLSSYRFNVSSYVELGHIKDKHYKRSWRWFHSWRTRWRTDGVNSLVYSVKELSYKPLYVHIYINIDVSAVKKAYNGTVMIAEEEEEPFE